MSDGGVVEVHAGIAVSKPPSMFLCFMSHSMPTSPSSRARCLQLWVGFGGWGEDSSRSRRKGRSPDFTRDKMQGGGGVEELYLGANREAVMGQRFGVLHSHSHTRDTPMTHP
jgi:hypothetical protein